MPARDPLGCHCHHLTADYAQDDAVARLAATAAGITLQSARIDYYADGTARVTFVGGPLAGETVTVDAAAGESGNSFR